MISRSILLEWLIRLIVLQFSHFVIFLRHGENNGFCPIIWNGFLHSYITADVGQLVNDAITTMLKEFSWKFISFWGFPCFQLFDSCYNSRAKDSRFTTVVRSKGWCVKTGRINGRLMIVHCLSIFKPPQFHLIWIGKKNIRNSRELYQEILAL